MIKATLAALSLLAAGSASAQAGDWGYKATLYGWFPGISATVDTLKYGSVDAELSSSDALQNLDMAFMGTFAASNGQWSFVGDLLYTNLSAGQPTPFGTLFSEATVSQKLTAFSGYALYRVSQDTNATFDLGVGFRTFDMDVDVDLSAGDLPQESFSTGATWTDPLIAARFSAPINDKWFVEGFADYGGTGSGDETWQLYGGVGYWISEDWSTQVGYRYMDISKEINGRDLSFDLSGLLIAFSYNF